MPANSFGHIEDCMQDCIDEMGRRDSLSSATLNDLKKELNRAFPGCVCRQVIFCDNKDKLFFGMTVYAQFDDDNTVRKIVESDDPVRVSDYILEIDSKLFDPILHLTSRELTAIVMHEVGHMTNTSNPVDEVRKAIDAYLVRNNDVIKISDSANYAYILRYAIQDTLIKVTSLFYQKDEEYKADTFAFKNGYGEDLQDAMEKIYRKGYVVNRDVNDKFIVLAYCLRLYKDVKMRRIAALRAINRAKSLTPSTMEIKILDTLADRLKRIDDASLIESSRLVTEGIVGRKLFDMKMKGISSFENDLYEYRMTVTNIDEQDEAILVMRQINARLAILEDMLTNKDASENQKQKIFKLIDQFKELRDILSRKVTYKDRYVGVIVNYPAIKGLDY